jgi:hypothetical protein
VVEAEDQLVVVHGDFQVGGPGVVGDHGSGLLSSATRVEAG